MTAFYNEIDPFAAAWLRELIAAGHIAPGVVDTRSIEDIQPGELDGYTQCHFFAGIGGWSLALRRAGWPDDRAVWTGSCPCQPFSAAGKGNGFADERHLWPAFHHLISVQRPPTVFGEQVASKDTGPWIDLVHADLEALGYAFGAIPFPAAGIGAPHIRDRLYWVADASDFGRIGRRAGEAGNRGDASRFKPERLCDVDGLALPEILGRGEVGADTAGRGERGRAEGPEQRVGDGGVCSGGVGHADQCAVCGNAGTGNGAQRESGHQSDSDDVGAPGDVGGMANTNGFGSPSDDGAQPRVLEGAHKPIGNGGEAVRPSPTNGLWADADWLLCRDGKWRPVEPGTFPLAHGPAARVGRLRAYGNAIVAPAAQAFIEVYLESRA